MQNKQIAIVFYFLFSQIQQTFFQFHNLGISNPHFTTHHKYKIIYNQHIVKNPSSIKQLVVCQQSFFLSIELLPSKEANYKLQQSQVQLFNSQMQSQNQYHYDFSYSINFDNIPFQNQNLPDLQHSFRQWSDVFLMMNILKEDDLKKSTSFVFRAPFYRKLGIQLLDLCLLTHSDQGLQLKQSKTQKIRQQNYESLKQLQKLSGREKNKSNDILTLCLYATIQKVIQQNIDNELISNIYKNVNVSVFDDDFVVFHMVCWEIKGQLFSKQNMEGLITKYFELSRFNTFMHKSIDEISKALKPKMEQPLTFRASIINKEQKVSSSTKVLYQSFKQISLRNEKQNLVGNLYPYQKTNVNNEQQSIEQQSSKNSFLTFRKKLNYENAIPRQAPKIMFKRDEKGIFNQQQQNPNKNQSILANQELIGFKKIKTQNQPGNENMSFSTLRDNQQQDKRFSDMNRRR